MKNKKKLAVASLVMSIASLIPNVILPDSLIGAQIFVIVAFLLAITAVVLGFISRKDAKGLAISGIIVGILSALFLFLSLMGLLIFQKATNCVDDGNGMSTCEYLGQEVEVPTSYLTEDQMKKGD